MVNRAYFYLVSSLPHLELGQTPPMSSEEFLEHCRDWMTAAAWNALHGVSLLPREHPCCNAERQWHHWETYLRNAVAGERGNALGVDEKQWQRYEADVFPGMGGEIDECIAAAEPVECEKMLDQLRWRFLDGLIVGHEFDMDRLVVYRLQLLIAEKWAAFSEEAGRACLEDLERALYQQAEENRQQST